MHNTSIVALRRRNTHRTGKLLRVAYYKAKLVSAILLFIIKRILYVKYIWRFPVFINYIKYETITFVIIYVILCTDCCSQIKLVALWYLTLYVITR